MVQTAVNSARTPHLERREWPRYTAERTFALAASVAGKVVPCIVADVSLGGARLIFDEAIPAAPAIELSHPDADPVYCASVWRNDTEVGVAFDFSEDSLGLISVCIRNMIDLEQQQAVPA